MQAHIQKWGNSLGVRIPKGIAKELHLHPGSPVTLEIEDGRIVVQVPQYTLDALLEGITSKNQHHEIFDDAQEGKEEW